MRTTIVVSDKLFRLARRRAAEDGVSLRDVIEAALRGYLRGAGESGTHRLRWRTERGRLLPGVNLDDREALFDLMDSRK